jgi:hypothetical protein
MPSYSEYRSTGKQQRRAAAHRKILALGILEGSSKYYSLLYRWS